MDDLKKYEISNNIKPITLNQIKEEYRKLSKKSFIDIGERDRLGNNIVDYFTFKER
jgi:hypothetical protein